MLDIERVKEIQNKLKRNLEIIDNLDGEMKKIFQEVVNTEDEDETSSWGRLVDELYAIDGYSFTKANDSDDLKTAFDIFEKYIEEEKNNTLGR